MKRVLAGLIGATLAATSMPALAVQTVLTFDDVSEGGAPACTNADGGVVNQQCNNGNWVGVNYGTTPQLAVSFDAGGSATSLLTNVAYFSANGPIYSGAYSAFGPNVFSAITFTPTAGNEVSFQSLTYFAPSATAGIRFFEVRDGMGNLVASDTGALGNGMYAPNTGYFSGPLTFLFRNEGGALVIDNVTVDVRGIAAAGVPEPAAWALMLGGFGMAGAAMRRRRGGVARVLA